MSDVLTPSEFRWVVGRANLAPSVHNTQPTRWKLDADGAILLLLDRNRQLAVGDPLGRDARLSCGAALEGTRLALSKIGRSVHAVEISRDVSGEALSPVLRIEAKDAADADPAVTAVDRRFTWRGGFAKANDGHRKSIIDAVVAHDDASATVDPLEIERLADLNDSASLSFFRQRPYREELVHWMRLSRRHPQWANDGLNADALGMTRFEAMAAGVVMRSPVFDVLNSLGLSRPLVSEASKTKSAAAIVLFHRPTDEDPVDSGVAFYRLLLSFAVRNLAAWPMAVLADDPGYRAEISTRYKLADDRRLINVLRVGAMPIGAKPGRARIDATTLILDRP